MTSPNAFTSASQRSFLPLFPSKQTPEVDAPPLLQTVGVSNFSQSELIKISDVLASHGVKLASNQVELNLLRQSPLKNGLMEEMNKRGVVCLAYSPLAQGRLTGKYSAENPPPKGRKFSNIPMETIDPLVEEMKRIAEARGVSVSAIALNWVLSKGKAVCDAQIWIRLTFTAYRPMNYLIVP